VSILSTSYEVARNGYQNKGDKMQPKDVTKMTKTELRKELKRLNELIKMTKEGSPVVAWTAAQFKTEVKRELLERFGVKQ